MSFNDFAAAVLTGILVYANDTLMISWYDSLITSAVASSKLLRTLYGELSQMISLNTTL